MKELISIIIPIYNTQAYLSTCLESVLLQTYTELEIILVDDGSTDGSGTVCEEYAEKDGRIKVIHKENGGVSDARNIGIRHAHGRYIGFIDSDDFVEANMYEVLYELMIKNNADITMISCYYVKDNNRTCKFDSGSVEILRGEDALKYILLDEKIQSYMCNKLYKTELFDQISFPDVFIMEDVAVNYKLFQKINTMVCADIPLYNYVYRTDSASRKNLHQKNKMAYEVIRNRFFEAQIEIPHLKTYNIYSLVLWSVRTYSFLVKDNDENDMFLRQDAELLKSSFLQEREYITDKLPFDKLCLLYAMLWDFDKGKEIAKAMFGAV